MATGDPGFQHLRLDHGFRRHSAKVWRAYQPGQEVTKTPSQGYLEVAREVQAWIATRGQWPTMRAALGWLINRAARVDGPAIILQFASEADARGALAQAHAAYDRAKESHHDEDLHCSAIQSPAPGQRPS